MKTLMRLLRTPEGLAGSAILLLLAALALFAPVLFPRDPLSIAGRAMLPPFTDWATPLGTDRLGRNVLAGLVHGTRASLAVGLATAFAAIAIATARSFCASFFRDVRTAGAIGALVTCLEPQCGHSTKPASACLS